VVVEGRAPSGISLQMLMYGRLALPLGWLDQQAIFSTEAHENPVSMLKVSS
jgi:hypothetical protein